MWINEQNGGFYIKAMFGKTSDSVDGVCYPTHQAALGKLLRWHYKIEKPPVTI